MLRKVGIAFFGLVLLLFLAVLIIAFTAPAISSIEQEITIEAPAEQVWPLVATFEKRNDWNPFIVGIDDLETHTSGPDGEVGSIYSWTSKATIGSQTITEIVPGKRFASDLHFKVPFAGEAKESLNLTSQSDGTTLVQWTYTQPNKTFIDKLFAGLGLLKKVMNKSYASGLEKLKKIAEQ